MIDTQGKTKEQCYSVGNTDGNDVKSIEKKLSDDSIDLIDREWFSSLQEPSERSGGHTGLHKLCFSRYARGGAEENPRWDDVRRFLSLRDSILSFHDKRKAVETRQGKWNWNALHWAAWVTPPLDAVKKIVDISPGLAKTKDSRGDLPVHVACRWGVSLDVLRLLVEAGGRDSLSVVNFDGKLPLHLACMRESRSLSLDEVQLLVSLGGLKTLAVRDQDGRTAIHCACSSRNVSEETLTFLIRNGGAQPLVSADNDGLLPIHHASFFGVSEEIVRLQVAIGGRSIMKHVDGEGRLPMHHALRKSGTLLTSEYLTEFRCESFLNLYGGESSCVHRADDGRTPLHYACQFEASPLFIEVLIQMGGNATIHESDIEGRLPLHYACRSRMSEMVVPLLIDKGGIKTLQHRDKLGKLPLHYAFATNGSENTIQILIGKGGSELLEVTDNDGNLPFMGDDSKVNLYDVIPPPQKFSWWRNQLLQHPRMPMRTRDEVLAHPSVQKRLNEAFIRPGIVALTMLDFYSQTLLIAAFSFASSRTVYKKKQITTGPLTVLVVGIAWQAFRETFDFLTRRYKTWVSNIWNWLCTAQIVLVILSLFVMVNSYGDLSKANRAVLVTTGGVTWFELLGMLKNFFFDIGVFVFAVEKIILKLVPFLVTTGVIISAFAQMIYTANSEANSSLGSVYAELYAMFLGGVEVTVEEDSSASTGLLFAFGFIIGLIFLNVLIAKIANVFTDIEDQGEIVFWRNRLVVVSEAEAIFELLRKCFCGNRIKLQTEESKITEMTKHASCTAAPEEERFSTRRRRHSLMGQIFADSPRERNQRASEKVDAWIRTIICRIRATVDFVVFFTLGLVSVGLLWPEWMKEWLFFGNMSNFSDKSTAEIKESISMSLRFSKLESFVADMDVKTERSTSRLDNKITGLESKMARFEEKLDRTLNILMLNRSPAEAT